MFAMSYGNGSSETVEPPVGAHCHSDYGARWAAAHACSQPAAALPVHDHIAAGSRTRTRPSTGWVFARCPGSEAVPDSRALRSARRPSTSIIRRAPIGRCADKPVRQSSRRHPTKLSPAHASLHTMQLLPFGTLRAFNTVIR
ncbi:unnamed protein product, partial [Iphiclides podalirius]